MKLLFDLTFNTSEVLDKWKRANVSQTFKKGSSLERKNLSPISLTSTIFKILKSLTRDKIIDYMQISKLITPKQHGFVPKKACLTN